MVAVINVDEAAAIDNLRSYNPRVVQAGIQRDATAPDGDDIGEASRPLG